MTQLPGTNTIEEEVAISLVNFERRLHGFQPIKIRTMKRKNNKRQWEEYIMKAQIVVGVTNHYWGQKGL